MQEVSGIYTSLSLNNDYLKTASRARKVSRAFEKRTPGLFIVNATLLPKELR